MNKIKLKAMLQRFFIEDVGDMDLSAELLFAPDAKGEMQLIAKESCVFSGADVIREGFRLMDAEIAVVCHVKDGEQIEAQQVIATASGAVRSLLSAERVILNCIQRMSAIATKTAEMVALLEGSSTRLCDTRKTVPGLRMLDKYAVRSGGGFNHRSGLYDAVMLKDNHLAYAGSIKEAVARVRSELGHTMKIEVEIETRGQLIEAVEAGADIIMFDNRTPEEIISWLPLVPETIVTEASGNISAETLAAYGTTGVDYISVGALTHSVTATDISAVTHIEERDE